LSKRESFGFRTGLRSDCAPLSSLISDVLSATGKVSALRDATRGGLARVLIELSGDTKLDFEIDINQIPINKETAGICEFLGMDPLYIANEGKMVLFVRPDAADEVLQVMKTNKYGKDSRIIGKVLNKGEGIVALKTEIGTRRILDLHYSEQLPRIC
jgi:hydrogenase expression/formation protein HypE